MARSSILGALIVGAVAGGACAYAVGLKFKFGLDDSLDVVGVHLVGGIVGCLLIGFVGTNTSPQGVDGLFGDMNGLLLRRQRHAARHQFLRRAVHAWSGPASSPP